MAGETKFWLSSRIPVEQLQTPRMLSDSTILKKIQRQPKQMAGYKTLVRELGLHGDQRKELSGRLQKMISRGELVAVDSDRYAIPQASSGKNLVTGKLSVHRDVFGFVMPDPKSLSGTLKAQLSGDIFIPPPAIGSAMHGDQVLVEVTNVRPDGRAEGRVIRPVRRAHATVVGIFHYGSRQNYVVPIDAKISQQIVIPAGMETPPEAAESTWGQPPRLSVESSSKSESGLPARGQPRAAVPTRSGKESKHRVLG
jgi:ribonuclease R